MRRKLFTVTDTFKIDGRGTVVVGEQSPVVPDFKIGSPIVLISPEGREIIAKIGGTDAPTTVNGTRLMAVFIQNITKDEVPIGTEIFLET